MIRVAIVGEGSEELVKQLEKSDVYKVACVLRNPDELARYAGQIDLVLAYSDVGHACNVHKFCDQLSVPLQLLPAGCIIKREVGDDELIKRLMETGLFPKRPPSTPGDGDYLKGKRVMITGAGGSIGSDLAIKVASFGPEHLVLLDNSENGVYEVDLDLSIDGFANKTAIVTDIRDLSRLSSIMDAYRPQIMFHVAARKHVPLMEKFPEEAVTTNIGGTMNALAMAKKHGVELFTFISTDKAADPANVMGATKRVAERIIVRHAMENPGRYCIVRFENVLDSNGNVVYTFKRQLLRSGHLTVTSPQMNRYFITRDEASSFIVRASKIAQKAEVYVPDAGKPVFIVDLAKAIAKILGYREGVDYKITFTKPREGEKMSEELLTEAEQKRAQKLDGMFMCQPDTNDPEDFEENIKLVMEAAARVDRPSIIKLLQKLEPTYKI